MGQLQHQQAVRTFVPTIIATWRQSHVQLAIAALLVFVGCYLGAGFGSRLRFPEVNTAILFPPYAVLTAALILTPIRSWWLLALAAALGNCIPHMSLEGSATFVILAELANVSRAIVAALGIRLVGAPAGRFNTLRDMTVFIAFAAALGPIVGACIGTLDVAIHRSNSDLWLVWQSWVLSNVLTGLTLLPLLLLIVQSRVASLRHVSRARALEGVLLAVGTVLVAGYVFAGHADVSSLVAGLYAPLPFLLWAAVRFRPAGTFAALSIVSAIAIVGAIGNRGPFLSHEPAENILQLQLFLLAIIVPMLFLAAVVQQNAQTAAAEDALERESRRKDEFLAMLGHELRNPLAPIGIAVEVMRTHPPASDSIAWARDVIARQVAQLTRLVDDLLDVSRITRGKIKLNIVPLDFACVIAQALETARPLITGRDHDLEVDLTDDPLPVCGDVVRLAQIVSNLLNNAAKYTDEGGCIQLHVRACGSHIVTRVVDNGIGIPPHMLGHVFEMFRQIDDSSDRSKGGLGIGLALVKQLVELHGGTVEAHSEGQGKGSEFIVRLPLAARDVCDEAPSCAIRPDRNRSIDDGKPAAHRRILVVDDNIDAADALSRMLRLQKHEVLVAYDGLEAVATAERSNPDVVLLDIGLPKLDGLEVARRIRNQASGTAPILVATTGFGQSEERARTAAAGFDHHLVKPIDLEILEMIVQAGRGVHGRARRVTPSHSPSGDGQN